LALPTKTAYPTLFGVTCQNSIPDIVLRTSTPNNITQFVNNFAGARIARASQGYEPYELLLLYPALYSQCFRKIPKRSAITYQGIKKSYPVYKKKSSQFRGHLRRRCPLVRLGSLAPVTYTIRFSRLLHTEK
jgi:hypothetical protein